MYALRTCLLLYGPQGHWRRWTKLLLRAQDAIYRKSDPWPVLDQVRMLGPLLKTSRTKRISLIEVTTSDLKWNGER